MFYGNFTIDSALFYLKQLIGIIAVLVAMQYGLGKIKMDKGLFIMYLLGATMGSLLIVTGIELYLDGTISFK
ncbi:hypothetical protein WKH56_32770 [Priestia sp. SB1]|uniref:hypothetical protein n=1 Tax=Priestia sp. SB1 TaxID=3132359 RepID=UPI003180EFCA